MNRWMAKIISNDPTRSPPRSSSTRRSGRLADHSFSNVLPPVTWSTPSSLPNWPTMIWIDMPVMNPAMIAFDMKLAIHPAWRARNHEHRPVVSASAAVSATAVS